MSEWMNGPLYKEINKRINDYLNLEKEIYIQFFINPETKKPDKDLHVFIKDDNHKFIEMKYINPRKKINKIFNSLSSEDNVKLREFLNTCGKDLLKYQNKKIRYEEITKRLSNVFNNEEKKRMEQLEDVIVEIANNKCSYNPLFIKEENEINKEKIIELLNINNIENILCIEANYIDYIKYSSIDYLIIEKLESLQEEKQNNFFHTFNKLYMEKVQIIILSSKDINELNYINVRILNRLKWGLII